MQYYNNIDMPFISVPIVCVFPLPIPVSVKSSVLYSVTIIYSGYQIIEMHMMSDGNE